MSKLIVVYKETTASEMKIGLVEMPEGPDPEEFASSFKKNKGFKEVLLIEAPINFDLNSCDFWNEDGEVAREHF